MKTEEIVTYLEKLTPLNIQESWDNSGIQIKAHNEEISSITLTLDISLKCVSFAEKNGSNLIISHHPLFFSNFKNISIDDYTGKILSKCFNSKINIVSLHTNIDASKNGLADYVANKLNLKNVTVLSKKSIKQYKIVTFIPEEHIDAIIKILEKEDISIIDNYKACSFYTNGVGTFYPLDKANPSFGNKNRLNKIDEFRIEIIADEMNINYTLKLLKDIHPYESPAIDIYEIKSIFDKDIGFGRIGNIEKEMELNEFLNFLKKSLNIKHLRYVKNNKNNKVKKVGICPGSGMSLINDVNKKNVDVFITGDVKYHDAFKVKEEMDFHLIDIGHFESEIFFIDLVESYLNEMKIPVLRFEQKEIFEYK